MGFTPEDAPRAIHDVASLGYLGYETFGEYLDAWEPKGGPQQFLDPAGLPVISAYCNLNLTDASKRKEEGGRTIRWARLIKKTSGVTAVIGPNGVKPSALAETDPPVLQEATRLLREQTGNKTIQFENFDLYSLRHTCMTRWAPHVDPWTLMRLAGHRDMATTMRYIHPEDETTRQAMQRARDSVDRRAKEAVERARRALQEAQGRDDFRDSPDSSLESGGPDGRVN